MAQFQTRGCPPNVTGTRRGETVPLEAGWLERAYGGETQTPRRHSSWRNYEYARTQKQESPTWRNFPGRL